MTIDNIDARIKHRVDTTDNWELINPILYKGEFGLEEIDSIQASTGNTVKKYKIKVGDGVSRWEDLDYAAGEGGSGGSGIYVKVSKQGRITTVQAIDSEGVTTSYVVDGKDGIDGKDGKDGVDGYQPEIAINKDGYWVIDGTVTNKKAVGDKGDKGDKGEKGDGFHIDHYYSTFDELPTSATESETAIVLDGGRLFIYSNTNGWIEIGDFGSMTAVKGEKGDPGTDGKDGVDGVDGITPSINSTTNHWMLGTVDTGVNASGIAGPAGKNGEDGYSPRAQQYNNSYNDGKDLMVWYKKDDGSIESLKFENVVPSFDITPTTDGNKVVINKGTTNSKTINIKSAKLQITQLQGGLHEFKIINPDGTDGDSVEINTGYTPTITVTQKSTPGIYDLAIDNNGSVKHVELNAGYSPTISFTDVDDHTFKIEKVDKNGTDSRTVTSPTLTFVDDGNGKHTIKKTDCNGTDNFSVVSPTISVSSVSDVENELTITDIDGTKTVNISSATASVVKNGREATITITDANGTTSTTIFDGEFAYDDTELKQSITDLSDEITYTDDTGALVDVGGWKTGDTANKMSFQDFAYKLLHPHVNPIITKFETPEYMYQAKGSMVNPLNIYISAQKGAADIASIEVYVNGVSQTLMRVGSTTAATASPSGGNYYISMSNVSNDISAYAVITDVLGKTTRSQNIEIKFINKTYYGTVSASITTPTESNVKSKYSALVGSNAYTYNINTLLNNEKIFYAYPKSFGALNSIKDANNFEYLSNSYNRYEITVDNTDYYCYITKNATTTSGSIKQIYS